MMRYVRTLLPVLFVLLCSGTVSAAEKAEPFFFMQLADTQIGFTRGDSDLSPEINNFRKAVVSINRLKPAFVVISGDMINSMHDAKQVRAFWQVAREIDKSIPLYLLPGNHDVAPGTEADVRSYTKLFGKDHYSFAYKGSAFVVLDSSVIHYPESDPAIRKAQRVWFEQELDSARKGNANHIFVLTHHAWFVSDPNEGDTYDNIPQVERRDYLALMDKYGVDFAAAGHFHKEAFGKSGKLSMITTCAVSKGLGSDPEGFRIFKVYKDHVEHTYYALDKAPEKVSL